jgi:3-methylcrotonyl-CoA carboxylase alpha subunit
MPGKVVSFAVKAGDAVTKGQPLAVMEAMKMEHTIAAPADGVVQELLYAPGDQVTEGAELLKLVVAARRDMTGCGKGCTPCLAARASQWR